MYRVVTISLLLLVLSSVIASVTGLLYYRPLSLICSLIIALAMALSVNIFCARLWRIHANHESAVITAFILFFMMIPSATITENWQLATSVALAMLSKYLLVWQRQHIFNPAAMGAVALVLIITMTNKLLGTNYNTDIFSWWVANPILLLPVLFLGLLVVSKVRRMTMLMAFLIIGLTVFIVDSLQYDPSIWNAIKLYFVSYPTLFLGLFMLTEPFTTPPRHHQQIIYGGLVGALTATSIFSPLFSMTPELALVLSNLFVFTLFAKGFSLKRKLFLKLTSKRQIATNTWEFSFAKPKEFDFKAGQYGEWMLPHAQPDSRGVRRYFTIASSPNEDELRLVCRIIDSDGQASGSSYKKALLTMGEGSEITLSQVSGDFLLPNIVNSQRDNIAPNKSAEKKIAMIAGGIGITPFISHLIYIHDTETKYDVSLYYCVRSADEFIYMATFAKLADKINLTIIPVIAKDNGYITEDLLTKNTPDFQERVWYLSGPTTMVNNYKELLQDMGVTRTQIKTDYFPGLA